MIPHDDLTKVFTQISDFEEMKSFIEEILTPKEIQDLALRWKLLQELGKGETQRSIASKYGISLCKITRGSKILKKDQSVTKKYLRKEYAAPEPEVSATPDKK
ncbi:MAG: Trp family transcriptional regulator [Syntrophales bacterium]|nr:Trp family transcriptional regulator [Syntrophales bacterium]